MVEQKEMRTLPQVAMDEGMPLDPLRTMIRQDAQLQELGTRYGPTRVYTVEEVTQLKAAFEMWKSKKSKRIAVA
jgi:hypothetical protein